MFGSVDLSPRLGQSLGIVPGAAGRPACCHQPVNEDLTLMRIKPGIAQAPKPTSDDEIATVGCLRVPVR